MNRVLVVCRLLVLPVMLLGEEASAETIPISIIRSDPRFEALLPAEPVLERIAGGLSWVEGPVWHKGDGYLLFSDIPANTVYKWKPGEGLSLYLEKSGYRGTDPFEGNEPGSNGLAFDAENRLILCRHGDRQIARLEPDGRFTVLADHFGGQRLNSPNDLVLSSTGDLYFTDPPFGRPRGFDDPDKAPVQGVYRLSRDGTLALVIRDLTAPNGLALSPDERYLYVSDVDPKRSAWLAYEVHEDGTLGRGRILFNATPWRQDPYFGPDGFKIDEDGNIWGARPGGISVIAPDGTLLGTIETGKPTSNVAWGEDGRTLFVTSADSVYRLRLRTRGARY